jgi:hypothetical protein
MNEARRKRAIEWYLYLHSEQPVAPVKLIQTNHYRLAQNKAVAPTEQNPGPELYGTGLSADEGLWHRKGWAGRT